MDALPTRNDRKCLRRRSHQLGIPILKDVSNDLRRWELHELLTNVLASPRRAAMPSRQSPENQRCPRPSAPVLRRHLRAI